MQPYEYEKIFKSLSPSLEKYYDSIQKLNKAYMSNMSPSLLTINKSLQSILSQSIKSPAWQETALNLKAITQQFSTYHFSSLDPLVSAFKDINKSNQLLFGDSLRELARVMQTYNIDNNFSSHYVSRSLADEAIANSEELIASISSVSPSDETIQLAENLDSIKGAPIEKKDLANYIIQIIILICTVIVMVQGTLPDEQLDSIGKSLEKQTVILEQILDEISSDSVSE